MRELIEMNKKEKRARFSVLTALIRDDKKLVREELSNYRKLGIGIRRAKLSLEAAERSYERRESKRNARKIKASLADRDSYTKRFNESAACIAKLLGVVRRDYLAMAGLYYDGRARMIMDRCENYNDSVVWSMISTQLKCGINENIELEEEY